MIKLILLKIENMRCNGKLNLLKKLTLIKTSITLKSILLYDLKLKHNINKIWF